MVYGGKNMVKLFKFITRRNFLSNILCVSASLLIGGIALKKKNVKSTQQYKEAYFYKRL